MTSPQSPRTSVIMPVYNTEKRVVSAITSVLAQTDPDFELLVMIDASPDQSSETIHRFPTSVRSDPAYAPRQKTASSAR